MRSFVVQFAENEWVVIPSYTSFASVGCIRDVVILEVVSSISQNQVVNLFQKDKTFSCLGGTMVARGGIVGSVLEKMRNVWSNV